MTFVFYHWQFQPQVSQGRRDCLVTLAHTPRQIGQGHRKTWVSDCKTKDAHLTWVVGVWGAVVRELGRGEVGSQSETECAIDQAANPPIVIPG